MKRVFTLFLSILLTLCAMAQSLTMTVNDKSTTMTNVMSGGRKLVAKINSSGRVSSMTLGGTELLSSNGIYFDYTTANGNQGLNPTKVTVIKNTEDYCEVLYSSESGNTIWQQGFIMRKGVQMLYVYVIATGTATSASEPIKEARVCCRTSEAFLNGYVDWRMNGRIPSNSEMTEAEKEANTIQDATYRLTDGSIYTKYNWANYIERDTLHGLRSDKYYGLYNIPVSYEWINGGCERQELTVHATSKSPITIQMLQGEHFGGQAMVLNDGEQKLYGPFAICPTYSTDPVKYARSQAVTETRAWPYQWFENDLYPRERGTVKGHLNVTTGQRNDSVRIVLAQEKGKDPYEMMHGYQFWTLTDKNGDFVIKNVRPGDYNLFAYAKAGEVTDMLEQDDITVTTGSNDLGTISWTPAKYGELLWMIGQNDRRSSEFHFSDALRQYGLWEQVPANLTYTIGESNENTDWYYAQTNDGIWTVKFNLDKRPSSGRVYLTASLAGCASEKATLAVTVNGTSRATWKPGYKDASVYRSALNSGRHIVYTTDFPYTGLRDGVNLVSFKISNSGGKNGIMYDCIKLEAGEPVTNGIATLTTNGADAVKTTKYLHQGRLVIERGGQLYTVDGKRLVK